MEQFLHRMAQKTQNEIGYTTSKSCAFWGFNTNSVHSFHSKNVKNPINEHFQYSSCKTKTLITLECRVYCASGKIQKSKMAAVEILSIARCVPKCAYFWFKCPPCWKHTNHCHYDTAIDKKIL